MPRSIDVTAPPDKIDQLVQGLKELDGIAGIARLKGVSIQPGGDILIIEATNDALRSIFTVVDDLKILEQGSLQTSNLKSYISPPHQKEIDNESNETTWDEMAFLLREETNEGLNFLVLMALSGIISAVGLWTNTLHIIIAAMVIAPAFEPLVRIPFGLITGKGEESFRGLKATIAGYLAMATGALAAYWVLLLLDPNASADLETRHWVQYWSTLSVTNVFLSAVAGIGGAVVIIAQRAVLTAGVMIALALVPSMTIVGMAAGSLDASLLLKGVGRWLVDAGLVLAGSLLVIGLKQFLLHRHRALS